MSGGRRTSSLARPAVLAILVLGAAPALAVSPLVVDDAGTVDLRSLQLNAGWRFARASSRDLNAAVANPVLGVNAQGEVGATFGYEWETGGPLPSEPDVNGSSDLLLSTKWRFFESAGGFQLGARLDLKLPAASEARGLGTGNTDLGGVLVATRCWGRLCLDWNAGYVADDVAAGSAADDTWFIGQAVRVDLGGPWTLLTEVYGVVPVEAAGPPSQLRYDGGPQYEVNDGFLVSAVVGSATGHGAPSLTAYVGGTWTF